MSKASVGFTLAGVPKQQLNNVDSEQQAQASHSFGSVVASGHGYEASGYGGEFEGHVSSDEGKQSNGAELTSLAHSSAVQARNAVQSQLTAGSQAAFGVKSSLASAAFGVRIFFSICH
ncbi:hypothetical protein NQ314_013221 [Rhamnusium bicolor]|uniref:Uncharacterized protein n=1 Tax=Rhamnusium bicolor TaxID=1586634 RepID=A0AAV8X7Z2_9CUCU|nr:hypothetical protein NQ314_013221 [Rhamnusium bicolor]